jgi:hypothetical protein
MGLLVCLLGMTGSARAASVCTEPLLMTPDEARDASLEQEPQRSAGLLLEALRALPPPPSDEELPWCASAEDPRCSPLPAHSTPPELAVRVFAATVLTDKTTLASAPAGEITHVAYADELPPASGVHARVERPPR